MRSIFAILLIAGLAACAPPTAPETVDVAEVRRAIEEANSRFMNAFNQRDAAGAAAVYTSDVIVLPPHMQMIRGREAAQQSMQGEMENLSNLKLTTVDVAVSGDLAVEVGNATIDVQLPESEESITDKGKYVVVWQRQDDGSWKIFRDIWNTDLPRQ